MTLHETRREILAREFDNGSLSPEDEKLLRRIEKQMDKQDEATPFGKSIVTSIKKSRKERRKVAALIKELEDKYDL